VPALPAGAPADEDVWTPGSVGAALFCHDSTWVVRRKHIVELLDDRTVRHKLSVDIAVPRIAGGAPISVPCLTPVFMLRKAPAELTNFDYRDAEGKALSLPTREENGRFSAEILLEIAVLAASHAGIDRRRVITEVGTTIRNVASQDTLIAAEERQALFSSSSIPDDMRSALSGDHQFLWLSELLETSCIVGFPVKKLDERQILKLHFDENQLDFGTDTRPGLLEKRSFGWEGYTFWFELPFIGSSSYHFEVVAPRGIEIIDSGVALETPEGKIYKRGLGLRERSHVYLRGAQSYRSGLGWALYRVYRGGFITGALISSGLVVMAIAAAAIFAGPIAKAPGSVPALLLLFPGALVALVYRPGRHELALRLLHHARLLLLWSAFVAYAVAARVAVLRAGQHDVSVCSLRVQLIVAAALAGVAFIGLVFTRLLPKVVEATPERGRYLEPTTGGGDDDPAGGRLNRIRRALRFKKADRQKAATVPSPPRRGSHELGDARREQT
jgi:hypothetical protein